MATHRDYLESQLLWLPVLDVTCLLAGVVAGISMRLGSVAVGDYFVGNMEWWIYLAAGIVSANYLTGSYGLEFKLSRFNTVVNWLFSISLGLLAVSVTSYAWLSTALGRGVLFLALAVYSALWLAARTAIYHFLFRTRAFSYRVAVIGGGLRCRELLGLVQNAWQRPVHRVVAIVGIADEGGQDVRAQGLDSATGIPLLRAGVDSLETMIRSLDVDVVVLAFDDEEDEAMIHSKLRRLRFDGVVILTQLGAAELYAGRIPLDMVDERWLMQSGVGFVSPAMMRFKRLLDVVSVLVFGLPALLLAAVVGLAVKVTSPRGRVFYHQERVGRMGRVYRMIKFRTMISSAEDGTGPVWSPVDDPRITRIGRFLRKYRLDELPQLWNVLKGDMSLVGPRPERPEIGTQLEGRIPHYRERENVPPGLTGWAQIRHPYGATVEDARRKLEFDLYYIKNLSLGLDLRIILQTLRIVLFGLERKTE